jgi:tripartite-type tricarboxylate transporter receptor subunit TctC
MTRFALRSLVFLAICGVGALAGAQSWPEKPVRFIASQGAGIPNDLALRWVAERLSKSTGRPFIVENVLGAGGIIAAQAALRAGPDGHTFYMAGTGFVATDRYMVKSIPYDADRDFIPVAMIFDTAGFLVAVHPDVPAKTLPELIALAKAQPGKLSYGSDIIGTAGVMGPWFNKAAGTDIVGVPYKSGAQLIQDLVAGRTQIAFYSIGLLDPHRRAGKVRALAVTSGTRYPMLPDIPTVSETLPGYRVGGMGLLVAHSGTSLDIVERLNREIDHIVRDPSYVAKLNSFGFDNTDGARTQKGLREFMRLERETWDAVFKQVKFEPQ